MAGSCLRNVRGGSLMRCWRLRRSNRFLAVERKAMQFAPAVRVIGTHAVHGARVVPHQQIAHAPNVTVDVLLLRGVGDERVEQSPTVGWVQADDVRSRSAEYQRLAP